MDCREEVLRRGRDSRRNPHSPPFLLPPLLHSLKMLQSTLFRRVPSTLLSLGRASTSALPTTTLRHSSNFSQPRPPALSRAEQKDFEELLRRVNAPASKPAEGVAGQSEEQLVMHPDFRQKPKPQFEGEVNPETGEVGGPKRDPLAFGESPFD